MKMKIAIIGTGGVGGYFGGKLAQSGYDVTFIARGEHLTAMRNKGLLVKSINGDFLIKSVKVTDSIHQIEKPDLVLICVKAWQVSEVAKSLKNIIKDTTLVLPLQNGVLAADEIAAELGQKHVLGGLCRILSKIESPGVINHFGAEPVIIMGEKDNSISERVTILKQLFDNASISSKIAKDIHAETWKKFISICVSGLLAVTRSPYGVIRELKETRQLMVQILEEVYLVSKKAGIKIEDSFVQKTIAFTDTLPYESTSSLARDVMEGKPSEIEYQNGTVVRLGEKYGIETPANRFIYNCILAMEIKARKQIR
jgi:2-dehydropantoate 2-reductase